MSWLKNLFKRSKTIKELAEDDSVIKPKAWTPDEVKFLQKNFKKIGAAEVAWQLGRSKDSVYGKARTLGL